MLHFYVLNQSIASKFSHFLSVCHQQTFRHPLIECLLLSSQNFDGCVEVPAVDTMSKDDKSVISVGVCNSLVIVEDIEQRFSNFFQVGTNFISQNVLRTTLLLGLSNSLGLP